MVDEGRLDAALAVELARIAFAEGHRLDIGVALRARHVVIDPGGVEELHQRPVERVDPDHRLVGIVAVVVPGAVRRQDQVAAGGGAALALDHRVAPLSDRMVRLALGECRHRRDVARIVDRDRAADGVGDLQPSVQPGIEQQDALAVGELDRRYVGLAGDLGDLVQVGLYSSSARCGSVFIWATATRPEASCPEPSPLVWLNQGRCAGAFACVRTQTLCLPASALIASISSRALLESPPGAGGPSW